MANDTDTVTDGNEPVPGIEILENCQLEWDKVRGVLYVHNRDTGATVLRICRMPNAVTERAPLGDLRYGQIDITGPFRLIALPRKEGA